MIPIKERMWWHSQVGNTWDRMIVGDGWVYNGVLNLGGGGDHDR